MALPSFPPASRDVTFLLVSATRYLVGCHLYRGVWSMDALLIESFPNRSYHFVYIASFSIRI